MTLAFAVAMLLAVTSGWENVDPCRHNVDIAPEKMLWRASLQTPADIVFVRKEGAEGSVNVIDGELKIEKTNDRGYLLVKAAPFTMKEGVMSQFRADVNVSAAVPDCSHAYLRADDGREWIGYQTGVSDAGSRPTVNCGLIQQPVGMYYRKRFTYRGEGKPVYPMIVVSGSPSVSTWKNWAADDRKDIDELFLKKIRPETWARRPRPEDAIVSHEEVLRQCAESIDHTAKLETENGVVYLTVDGRKVPPAAYHGVYHHSDYTEITTGQPITSKGVPITIAWVHGGSGDHPSQCCWTPGDRYDAKKAADSFREMMRGDTNALFMVCYDCNAYPAFSEEHPDEVYRDAKGNPIYGGRASCTPGYPGFDPKTSKTWPWISLASPSWRKSIKRNITAFVNELKRTGHAKKLIGIHFLGYNDGQFGMAYPDYSPCAKRAYEDYVADNPGISTNYWQFCRQLTTLCQSDFAKAFKQAMGKDVVAIRWDDAPFVADYSHGTMCRDPEGIDITVSQPTYSDRWPGLPDAPYVPWSSMALHNKMHWFELDLRTWWMYCGDSLAGSEDHAGGSPDDAHFKATHRKLVGEMLATRSGFWYYDMGRGWFAGPEISKDIGEVVKVADRLNSKKPSPWTSDVAVVVDEEGLFGVEGGEKFSWPSHLYNICQKQLRYMSVAGIPYDYYLAEDVIARPELLTKKKVVVFVFWRQFDQRRIDAIQRLFGRGQTHVFLCESGVLGGLKEVSGFEVVYETHNAFSFVVRPEPGFSESVRGSFEQEMIRGTGWMGKKNGIVLPRGRRAYVKETPGVVVHGRFDDEGRGAAIAERRDGEARRWYIAAPGGLSPEIFQRICRESGAYQPLVKPGLMVNMNGDFISLNTLVAGRYDFRLPRSCRVVNLRSGKEEQSFDGVMKLELTAGETCWFLLEDRP